VICGFSELPKVMNGISAVVSGLSTAVYGRQRYSGRPAYTWCDIARIRVGTVTEKKKEA